MLPKVRSCDLKTSMSMSGEARTIKPTLFLALRPPSRLDLPERLDRDPVAERMGEDVDLLGVARENQAQRVLEIVARGRRAVGVVDILRRPAARGPGEQHRHARRLRIVNELRRREHRFGEHRVEAVNEDEDAALSGRPAAQAARSAARRTPCRCRDSSASRTTKLAAGSPGGDEASCTSLGTWWAGPRP